RWKKTTKTSGGISECLDGSRRGRPKEAGPVLHPAREGAALSRRCLSPAADLGKWSRRERESHQRQFSARRDGRGDGADPRSPHGLVEALRVRVAFDQKLHAPEGSGKFKGML